MVEDASGAGALGLLDGPFMGTGFPSLTGGDAGPSSAASSSGIGDVFFNNPFSVAGQGGTANATATPTNTQREEGNTNMLLIGLVALAVVLIRRK